MQFFLGLCKQNNSFIRQQYNSKQGKFKCPKYTKSTLAQTTQLQRSKLSFSKQNENSIISQESLFNTLYKVSDKIDIAFSKDFQNIECQDVSQIRKQKKNIFKIPKSSKTNVSKIINVSNCPLSMATSKICLN